MKDQNVAFTRIFLVVVYFGLFSQLQAVVPPPDACYPNYTTAEGCDALSFLTTGAGNTGLGWYSLFLNAAGTFNTGVGAGTLRLNTADGNTATGAWGMSSRAGGKNSKGE